MEIIYGFGINDVTTPVVKTQTINGKSKRTWICPYYSKWVGMLHRCYVRVKPSYYEKEVCPEWKYFSNFRSWCISQKVFDQSLSLDKDILGKNLYSPEFCRFVPDYINNLIVCKKPNNDLPLGVTYDTSRLKYKSNISKYGRNSNSPRYDEKFVAHQWWQKEKIDYLTDRILDYKQSEYYLLEIATALTSRVDKLKFEFENGIETHNLSL